MIVREGEKERRKRYREMDKTYCVVGYYFHVLFLTSVIIVVLN